LRLLLFRLLLDRLLRLLSLLLLRLLGFCCWLLRLGPRRLLRVGVLRLGHRQRWQAQLVKQLLR
jgi:hypothetical protein